MMMEKMMAKARVMTGMTDSKEYDQKKKIKKLDGRPWPFAFVATAYPLGGVLPAREHMMLHFG